MKNPSYLLDPNWWSFLWRYWRRRTPWDTGITPPEVMDFLSTATPGRALDLGCGTGTNAITMARKGWQVTGIDFAPPAIRQARRKAAQKNLRIDFQVGDITRLENVQGPFDYVLDIGCLHSLDQSQHADYVEGVKRLVKSGGIYMLYAWQPRKWKGGRRGIAPETIDTLFGTSFHREKAVTGEEGGAPSTWYWFVKN